MNFFISFQDIALIASNVWKKLKPTKKFIIIVFVHFLIPEKAWGTHNHKKVIQIHFSMIFINKNIKMYADQFLDEFLY